MKAYLEARMKESTMSAKESDDVSFGKLVSCAMRAHAYVWAAHSVACHQELFLVRI